MKYLSQLVQILLWTVGIFSYDSLFSQTTTFTSSDTYTIPAGVTQIKVEAWGGGGRGGSRTSESDSYGGGGGGAYVSSIVNVTPLANYTVTVGLGSNNNANPGGDSWFSPNNLTNAIVLAKGGNSVPNNSTTGANGGYYADCIGDIRNNGGRGADGVHSGHGSGGGGASAGSTGIGPSAIDNFGAIAATGNDGTGGNGQTGNGNGSAGTVPGGGGGGARRTSGSPTGGNGANGRIIITVLGPQSAATTVGEDTQWVAPAGITAVEVEAWGAGGRGGQRSNNGRGGGGGGGAYSRGLVSVTAGQTYYYQVGVGSTTTSAGGGSWFNVSNIAPTSNNYVLAVGGNSAPNNSNSGATGGAATSGYGNVIKYSGGNGANSTGSATGGGGSSAGIGSNGNNATGAPGADAPTGGGDGGAGRSGSQGAGNAGNAPGGGGGGAYRTSIFTTQTGGAGARGQIRITYLPAITGTANLGVNGTSTLSNSVSGGTWSSSNPLIATVNSTTGEVTGVAPGSATITYTTPDGLSRFIIITVFLDSDGDGIHNG